eukprot:CAMPEP_0179103266 /NCGR_PEP_ID=MMETSP0796-20121207/47839_1 /TAXON_ID=73915 /ORGANISM="Pyrodinium bahamense, Strain pbaha01" /LENGTH=839 /DNA_ID=CAMNT_0020801167 /DNA_START=1 /DNA_END=2520 /DNA_ORIENTATION=+
MPRMAVYFPKYVCLNNPRLAIVYYILVFVIMGIAFFQFMSQERYNALIPVGGQASITSWRIPRTATELKEAMEGDASQPVCASPGQFDYEYGFESYTNISCAELCSQGGPVPCLTPGELYALEGHASIFYPTFFREEGDAGGSNRFVPGVGSSRLAFTHRYWVDQPSTKLQKYPDMAEGHSADDASLQQDQLLTVLLGRDGEIKKRWPGGEVITMTLDEMIEATKLAEFSDTVSKVSLDSKYTRVDEDIIDDVGDQGVTVRLSGMTLIVDLKYTNTLECQLDRGSPTIKVTEWTGKVCCMSIKGIRNWVRHEVSSVTDLSGRSVTRTYHGVRIHFRSRGEFASLNGAALFDGLTTLLIWAQIPLVIIYYFVITVLGRLSEVYSRVIHQSMSIKEACTGLASRLVGYSSAFLDVLDVGGESLNRARMVERFRLVFQDSEDLDDMEIVKLVDYIYTGMLGKEGASDPERSAQVCIQDFCHCCASNEPLSFNSLVSIFDKDRKLGVIESLFNDDTIKAIRGDEFSERVAEVSDSQPKPILMRSRSQLKDTQDYSQLETIMKTHARHKSRYARLQDKVSSALGSAEETLGKEEEGLFELRRLELLKQGKPENRPPVKMATGAVYHGDWVGTTRHGYGTETWPDGSTFEGQWAAGRLHGHAVYRQPHGGKYAGQWQYGKQHGKGVHVSETGAKYDGQFQHGMKNGTGKIFLVDGSTYEGEIVDNMMHGPGEYEWVDGNSYKGEWVNNVMHGEGVYTFSDGCEYTGQYRHNVKHGYGVFRWPDGKRYEGQYENNKRSGKGAFFMPDGTRIEGTWKDGKQDGPGTVTAPNGKRQEATWDMGILVQS